MSRPINEEKTHVYIGDGVFAEYNGFSITISTDRQENGVNWIALEPEALEALLQYAKTLEWLKSWEWDA